MPAIPEEPDEPQGDAELKWPRDSAEEDAAARTQIEADRQHADLARYQWEERRGRLIRALEEEGGLIRVPSEGKGAYLVPAGWAKVRPPERACPWCQIPAEDDVTCDGCARAQAAAPDRPAMIGWWRGLDPLARRLHLAARFGIDPWTGRRCRIRHETSVIDEAGVSVSAALLLSDIPRTSWDLRREV